MALSRHWHCMAIVNPTGPHCVNQMGKTHTKPLATRHAKGTAWARKWHSMLQVNRPLAAILMGTLERLLLRKAQLCEWRGIVKQIRSKTFKPKNLTFLNSSHATGSDMLRPDMSVGISGCGEWWLHFSHHQHIHSRSPVATPSNSSVCGRSLAGIAGSNPAGGIDVCLLRVLCVVR